MTKSFSFIICGLLLVALLLGSPVALAQQTSSEKNWQFNLAPFYLWAISIDGDVTQGTATVPVKVQFSDIFDNLESAFIVHFEAMNKNKWGFLVDVNYVDLEGDGTIQPGPGPGIQANVDFKNTIAELSGLYRINRDQHNFDLIAGIRYMELENTVTAAAGPVLADGSKDWVDPLIGARWLWDFADKWKLIARGDIGGFGVGSDFTWQALAAVD